MKQEIIDKEMNKAGRRLELQRNFIARNYWLWVIVLYFLYPALTLFSAFTEGSHVFVRMTSTYPFWLSVLLTLIVVGTIETLKYVTGKGMVDDLQIGVFSASGADKAMFFLKLVTFLAVTGYSVHLSLSGVPTVAGIFKASERPVEAQLVSVEDIHARAEKEMKPHLDNIDAMKRTTWKGSITRDALKAINKEQALIAQIQARRDAEVAEAKATNEGTILAYDAESAESGNWLTGIAGFGEVGIIVCLLFIGIFDDGVRAMAEEAASPTAKPSANPSDPGSTSASDAKLDALIAAMNVMLEKQNQPPPPPPQPAAPAPAASGTPAAAGLQQFPSMQPSYEGQHNVNSAPPPSKPASRIGFRQGSAPSADTTTPPPLERLQQVATGCNPEEEEGGEDYSKMDDSVLLGALSNAKRQYSAWNSKLKSGAGTEETNRGHMRKWARIRDRIQAELDSRKPQA